eukprot:m.240311 g.240311  ORF g.240311 m.240311 type:complete len:485 (+) comp16077_c0_seq4:104-1558(+)
MSCACSNFIRVSSTYSICLDVFLAKGLRPVLIKNVDIQQKDKSGKDAENKPLLPQEEPAQSNGKIYFAFALVGMAMSLTWGSISFPVSLWTRNYPHIWPVFNIMYNAPGFPILFALIGSDAYVESKLGLLVAYRFRLLSCFIALMAMTVGTGFIYGESREILVIWVAGIGILVGCLHAWIFSFASHLAPKGCGYILLGGGASTAFLVVANQIFPIYHNANPSRHLLVTYFITCTIPVLVGTLAVAYLLFSPQVARRLQNPVVLKNAGIQATDDKTQNDDDDDISLVKKEEKMPWRKIVQRTWPCLITIGLVSFSVVGVVGIVPLVPSQYAKGTFKATNLPTHIMYTTSFGIVIGSEMAVLLSSCMTSRGSLLAWELCRILMLPFAIAYAVKRFWLNDLFFVSFMGLYFVFGLFGMTKAFDLAQKLTNKKSCSMTVNICNVALYIGTYVGLTLPYWLLPLIKLVYHPHKQQPVHNTTQIPNYFTE